MRVKTATDPRLDILEKDLQKQVRQFAEALGWKVAVTWTSLHSPKGWPDLFMIRRVLRKVMGTCACGHDHQCDDHGYAHRNCQTPECACEDFTDGAPTTEAVAIELKREKGKTTPEQDAWLELLGRLPGVKFAGVIRPSDWHAGALDEVLR